MPVQMLSTRLKLERAEKHLNDLDDLIKVFQKRNPTSLRYEFNPDIPENRWYWEIVPEEPPAQLSPIVGDFIHNAWSSLDHLVNTLLVAQGVTVGRQHGWLVAMNPNDWNNAKGSRFAGLSQQMVTEIEGFQPGMRPNRPWLRTLRWLRDAEVIDKHRRFILTNVASNSAGMDAPNKAVAHSTDFVFGEVKRGAIYARLPGDQMNMEIFPQYDVSFGEGMYLNLPVAYSLRGVFLAVTNIITHFEALP